MRRNRRRYGGYTVHVGMAVLFVGVAASSAFQHARDVRLAPGQTATVGGYEIRYVRATAPITERASDVERIDSRRGARRARATASAVALLRTERGYYPSRRRSPRAGRARFFEGEATSARSA